MDEEERTGEIKNGLNPTSGEWEASPGQLAVLSVLFGAGMMCGMFKMAALKRGDLNWLGGEALGNKNKVSIDSHDYKKKSGHRN